MAAQQARAATRPKKRTSRRRWIFRALVLAAVLVAVALVVSQTGNILRSLANANPDLMRIGPIADAVGATIGDRPDTPAGTDPTVVDFSIATGASSSDIINDLVARELVTDKVAFTWLLVTGGGIDKLEAGVHQLNRTMTPREVAAALVAPGTPLGNGVPVVLRVGLRIEQIDAYLQTLPLDNLDPEQFYILASTPPDSLRQKFPWLSVIPAGRSLEGFLGSGAFSVDPSIDAEGMIELLLGAWQNSPSYALIAQAQQSGKDFYQAVTLASIVEHEAALDSEMPLIAGVYQNRIDGLLPTHLLNADPTIIYAKDTMILREQHISQWPDYEFWTLHDINGVGNFEPTEDLASFQTYHSRNLPDWPICSPGTAAIAAALSPNTADGYLYFVAKRDGSNTHAFARTLAEHQANIRLYWGDGATAEPTPSEGATP
ncbi:MAG: endolytic transglycosylase MltG [Chloroflexota bacterium]|nr:endolytic transglycosylase MltG [Chloroflexota bacterium]